MPELKSKQSLKEAANLGNWIEARIHLSFTEIADDLFAWGHVTREERIILSSAIGDGLAAYNTTIESLAPQILKRGPFSDPDVPMLQEVAEGSPNPHLKSDHVDVGIELRETEPTGELLEAALRRDGTIGIKIIQPGKGSSGFYPAAVLERDGPKVFLKGTQMYWDHQTATEEAERPEGSLTSLAGELVSDARWESNGAEGPGLYADAQVFSCYQEAVNELAGHIGVSIRAMGDATPGPEGPIIQRLTEVNSIDFVTRAGAGGEILELFESARNKATERKEMVIKPEPDERITTLQERLEIAKLLERQEILEQENDRLKEANILRDGRDQIARQLSTSGLPEIMRERVGRNILAALPMKEGALDVEALTQKVTEAVEAETEYVKSIVGPLSPVHGMGASEASQGQDVSASLEESFREITGSETAGKIAAAGR